MRRHWPWALLGAIPLSVVLRMWVVTGGLPYNTDSNETFSAFVQGQSLLHFDPRKNAFLPDDATGYHPEAHPFTYSHGPNLPRYFSGLLSLVGVTRLEWQILISAAVSAALSLWLIGKTFPEPLSGSSSGGVTLGWVVAALFATDFIGVLQFLGNLWRTWHFPLFWGCIWSVRSRPRWPACLVAFFLLFQLELLFALFTTATAAFYVLWLNRNSWAKWRDARYLAAAAGAVTSMGLFVVQLISFYGWRGLLFDLRTTYAARNSNSVEWASIREFYETHAVMMWPSSPNWDFRFPVYLAVTWNNMTLRLTIGFALAVVISLLMSVALSLYSSRRHPVHTAATGRANDTAAPLLWAMASAYLLLGVVIPGYTLNGYTYRWAPLLVFPASLSLALLVGNSVDILAYGRKRMTELRPQMVAVAIVGLLVPWLGVSLHQYSLHPDFVHAPAKLLSSKYRGHSFVSATTFPHMVAHYTGRWAYYSKPVFPGSEPLDQTYNWNADRMRNREYETPEYFLCQRLPYSGPVDCQDVARQMSALGHEVVEREPEYVIMKLNWHLPGRPSVTALSAR